MKNSIHPIFGFGLLLLFAILAAGCPIGISYPLCNEDQVLKVDNRLLGTWQSVSDSAEILLVKISKEDDITYSIEVLEQGENYMVESTSFYGWATALDGHTFLFSQGLNTENADYYTYHYAFEGKKLVIQDVSLLVGGVDAVTSTAAFRQEVSASLKKPDCLTSSIEYVKQ
jgi:hypothetical protein